MTEENIKKEEIKQYSDPKQVMRLSKKYFGKKLKIQLSTKKEKKYMAITPSGKIVHFGQMGYEDFTKHKNKTRRKNYLTRSAKIRGDWAKNKYSANNLARKLLW
jgi:2-succinyl-5-enolpyruvyl-6-hydroxy-3-cyclohexene-1-carboxylate synthase